MLLDDYYDPYLAMVIPYQLIQERVGHLADGLIRDMEMYVTI